MSTELESTEAKNPFDLIERARARFTRIIEADPTGVTYEKESMFAYQALTKTDFALKTAMNNPRSVINAITNIASVGLSLNPATSYAYLVPRDGMICLDVSYQGLIKIATDSGSIKWARADLVYSHDSFNYHGPAAKPEVTANPFGDRGDIVGVYCVAKTNDGDILTEVMAIDEILRIRDESAAVKYARSEADKLKTPWYKYFGEMAKKTVIKRASKTWPKSEQHERLQTAVAIMHEAEGSDWEPFTREDREKFDALVEAGDGMSLKHWRLQEPDKVGALCKAVSDEVPRGGKMKKHKEITELFDQAHAKIIENFEVLTEAIANDDSGIVEDVLSDLSEIELELVRREMPPLMLEQLDQVSA